MDQNLFLFDGLENYLALDLIRKNLIPFNFLTKIETDGNNKITSQKSTGMSQEKIINLNEADTNFSQGYVSSYGIVTFKGICLKQKSVSFLHKKVVNLYISYTLDRQSKDLDTDFTPGNCLFGAVKLTKNADPDKYKYSGYEIGFDSPSQFSWRDGSYEKILLFLEWIMVLLCILMIEIEIFQFLVKDQHKAQKMLQ